MGLQGQTDVIAATEPGRVVDEVTAARRRLEVLLDRVIGSAVLDPALLRELAAAANEASATAEAYEELLRAQWRDDGGAEDCAHSCWTRDFHCPRDQRFEEAIKDLQGDGYGPHRDAIDERVAQATRCVCGAPCSYASVRRGAEVRSFCVCLVCWHWLEF